MRLSFSKLTTVCSEHPFTATILFMLVVSVIFLIFPNLDIGVTQLFYAGNGIFPARQTPFFVKLRYLGPHIITWIAGISIAILLFKLALPRLKPLVDLRNPIFLLSTLIIGPGILVNAIFKNNWGRPRPVHIEQFGGNDAFVGVWDPTGVCRSNCSFVSGEGSSSMWLFALVFIAPKAWRLPLGIIIAVFCLAFSANRVAFGGHFLSDTLLSWGMTMLVLLSVYWLLYQRTPQWAAPYNLDHSFTKAGLWLHKLGSRSGKKLLGKTKSFLAKFK